MEDGEDPWDFIDTTSEIPRPLPLTDTETEDEDKVGSTVSAPASVSASGTPVGVGAKAKGLRKMKHLTFVSSQKPLGCTPPVKIPSKRLVCPLTSMCTGSSLLHIWGLQYTCVNMREPRASPTPPLYSSVLVLSP